MSEQTTDRGPRRDREAPRTSARPTAAIECSRRRRRLRAGVAAPSKRLAPQRVLFALELLASRASRVGGLRARARTSSCEASATIVCLRRRASVKSSTCTSFSTTSSSSARRPAVLPTRIGAPCRELLAALWSRSGEIVPARAGDLSAPAALSATPRSGPRS